MAFRIWTDNIPTATNVCLAFQCGLKMSQLYTLLDETSSRQCFRSRIGIKMGPNERVSGGHYWTITHLLSGVQIQTPSLKMLCFLSDFCVSLHAFGAITLKFQFSFKKHKFCYVYAWCPYYVVSECFGSTTVPVLIWKHFSFDGGFQKLWC